MDGAAVTGTPAIPTTAEHRLSLPALRRALEGATVRAVDGTYEGNGDSTLRLTVERGGVRRALVVGFNELGMWIESEEPA